MKKDKKEEKTANGAKIQVIAALLALTLLPYPGIRAITSDLVENLEFLGVFNKEEIKNKTK